MITLGSFAKRNYSKDIGLTYRTNSAPCSGYIFRSFNISLICSAGPLVISDVYEDSKCQYGVVMSGLAACGNQTQTQTPTQTPNQPKITCELSNNELTINSTSLIKCVGVGKTFCNIGSDVTCSTDSINGSITCTKSATIYSPSSISCIGNNIKCSSSYVECSFGNQSPNLLVNGATVTSNIYDSTTSSSNSPTITQTPNENDQSSNSSSTLLIFKNIVISILIISTTMLFL